MHNEVIARIIEIQPNSVKYQFDLTPIHLEHRHRLNPRVIRTFLATPSVNVARVPQSTTRQAAGSPHPEASRARDVLQEFKGGAFAKDQNMNRPDRFFYWK